jgi:hypothetical protein
MTTRRIYRIASRWAVAVCAATVVSSAGCGSQPQTGSTAYAQPEAPVSGTWTLAASDALGRQVFVESPAAASLFTPQAIARAAAGNGQVTVAEVPTDSPRP